MGVCEKGARESQLFVTGRSSKSGLRHKPDLLVSCRNFQGRLERNDSSCTKCRDGIARALGTQNLDGTNARKEVMLNVTVENIGELAVVECEGRIVQSEAAFKLRQAVTSQIDARIVVIDLSEVDAIEGGGLGMLVFLRRWARDHNIRFLLFDPSRSVRKRLTHAKTLAEFYVASLDEMMALLAYANSRYALAA
jgi:anti-anti-sigma factor